MKIIALFLLTFSAFAWAGVEQSWSPMILGDKDGNPIPGVSASTAKHYALEKAANRGDGDYTVIVNGAVIGRFTIKVGVGPAPDPDPIPEPDPEPNSDPEPTPAPDPDPEPPIVIGADSIVYTRLPRTLATHSGQLSDGTPYTVSNMDFMDSLPEVARITSQFNAGGQLVLRQGGVETVLYDCKDQPCVSNDPSVSLDGKKVAFSIMRSSKTKPPWPENRNYPNALLSGSGNEAQIAIHDLETGELALWPHTAGIKDVNPIWLQDGRILFSSTRDGVYGPSLNGIGSKSPKPRFFIADEDGSNVVDVSQHEIGALHPLLLNNGRIAYSTHWESHNLAYGSTNGSYNWPGTIDNFWAIADLDHNGGDITLLLGAHKGNMVGSNPRSNTMKALHFLGQRANNDLCSTNYYRANNLGLGDVNCHPLEARGIEGPTPSFIPRGLYSVAKWSTSEDSPSWKDGNGQYLGKVGWPEGTEDNQLILSVGFGHCTQVAMSVPGTNNKIGDQKGCDVGLYKTTKIPSINPDDLELIVDSPEWHEFGARVVRARNVPTPTLSTTGNDTCEIASSDAGSTDAHNYKGYSFNKNYATTANNGSEIDGLDHSELAAIRFYEVLPNKTKTAPFKNSIGNELRFLGDAPLLADKSFKAQLPCDTAFVMGGVDKDGLLIKRDQVPQSLRVGEKRVCKGCHLHSKQGRDYGDSLAATAPALPLLTPEPVPTYTNDIKPIFQARCVACHTDDLPLLDYKKLVWNPWQSGTKDEWKVPVKALQRPYISKYVNSMYARESLLYWKAANKRMDGRTDSTYSNDIDFGPDHPTDITPAELKAIGAWLDSGAAR